MKLFRISLITCALTLAGCSDSPDKASIDNAVQKTVKHVVEQSHLYAQLPENALAYVRVPNIYSITTAKDNSLRNAMGSDANVKEINKLREAINTNLIGELEMPFKPVAEFFLHHLRSSLELAVVPNKIESVPVPTLMLQGTFDFADGDALQAALEQITAQLPMLQFVPNTTDSSKGAIMVGPMSFVYDYESASKQLKLVAGMGLQNQDLIDYSALFVANSKHSMLALESQVDTSHKGLFAWVSAKNALAKYGAMVPPAQMDMVKQFGLDSFNALAIGSGTADGKGRTKIILDGAKQGAFAVLPTINNDLTFTTSGNAGGLFTFATPSGGEFKASFDNTAALMGESADGFDKMEKSVTEAVGVSLSDILDAIGPDHSIFSDQSGEFAAMRIRDKIKLDALLKTLEQKHQWQQTVTPVANVQVHELAIPAMFVDAQESMLKDVPAVLKKFLTNGKTRMYYLVEGDYLIFGQVPQALADRANAKNKTPIKQWLAKQQQDFSGTLLGVSGEFEQSPRKLYYAYLNALTALSDVFDASLDVYSFPSASQLNLPSTGTYGFQVDSTAQQFALELVYEVNPLEVVLQTPMAAAAVVGVLAAVALPAYQSYTTRASFSEVISATSAAETSAEVCAQIKGSFTTQKCASLTSETFQMPDGITLSISDQTDTQIVIKAERTSDNASYQISGSFAQGMVTWTKECNPAENCI
jgi:Tfp pilus assembly major pilin PilA